MDTVFGQIYIRDGQKERERTNERTNEFFINEGKGISTILFFIQPSGERERERERLRQ